MLLSSYAKTTRNCRHACDWRKSVIQFLIIQVEALLISLAASSPPFFALSIAILLSQAYLAKIMDIY